LKSPTWPLNSKNSNNSTKTIKLKWPTKSANSELNPRNGPREKSKWKPDTKSKLYF
jgi:hypothetical protein